MKQTLTFEVDVEKITQDLFEKEYDGASYNSVTEQVKQEIKLQAKNQLVAKLTEGLDIKDFISNRSYSATKYLSDTAQKVLKDSLEEMANGYIQNWINQNMKFVVEKSLRETFDKLLVPRLQKMIANMLIIDTESQEEQMKEMQEALEAEARGTYEAGQEDAGRGRQ